MTVIESSASSTDNLKEMNNVSEEKQFVIFRLGKETYGLGIALVREIITMQELTTVPKCAYYIKGIINLRGRVIPVCDLAGKFGLESSPVTKTTRIIVVEVKGITMGIIVDAVSEVLRIPSGVIEAPSGMITSDVSEQFIEGIAKYSDRLVIILDLESALIGADMQFAG